MAIAALNEKLRELTDILEIDIVHSLFTANNSMTQARNLLDTRNNVYDTSSNTMQLANAILGRCNDLNLIINFINNMKST